MPKGTVDGRVGKRPRGRPGKGPGAIGDKLAKILERYGKDLDIAFDKKIKYPLRGYALILNFKDTDLKHICEETETVTKAFHGLSCTTRTLHMDSENFEADLTSFLGSSSPLPRIIYISCRGEELTQPGELTLCGYVLVVEFIVLGFGVYTNCYY